METMLWVSLEVLWGSFEVQDADKCKRDLLMS